MHNLQKQLIAFHCYTPDSDWHEVGLAWISDPYDWAKEILGLNLAQK